MVFIFYLRNYVIMTYFIIVLDLAKQTPKSNSDNELLQEALAEVRRVMTLINEDKRKTEGQVALFDIFNEIENCPVSKRKLNV
jgi:protein ECT2